ncbi:polysaccharide deacetylase family protein [Paenarthrobacter histidinolovorans]|uniref:polysaccharide deacetylase family protein n=1 Tax=Paenarthrobacter histidinolovorans TaxID=43664 RepID=UPI00384D4209
MAEFMGLKPSQWGLQLPGTMSRLSTRIAGVVLTFDCCGGPGGNEVDEELISLLERTHTPAVFFLNTRWVQANPANAKRLAANPLFEIGNHGTKHIPMSVSGRSAYGIPGTGSPSEVYDEVMAAQDILSDLIERPPKYFRPGTAYFDDIAVSIVRKLGLTPVSFSVNGDGGATYTSETVLNEVSKAKAADIIIAHANHPGRGTAPGMSAALPILRASGLTAISINDPTAPRVA